MTLLLVQQALGHQADVAALGLPVLRLLGIVFERTVADELRIQAAVRGKVDVFVEDAVECRADFNAALSHVHSDVHLSVKPHAETRRKGAPKSSDSFHGC